MKKKNNPQWITAVSQDQKSIVLFAEVVLHKSLSHHKRVMYLSFRM